MTCAKSCSRGPRPVSGFTLIEAGVTLAVLAIILVTAAAVSTSAIFTSYDASVRATLTSIDQEARSLAQQDGQVDPRSYLDDAVALVEGTGDSDVTLVESNQEMGFATVSRYNRCATLVLDPFGDPGEVIDHDCGDTPILGGAGTACAAPSAPLPPGGGSGPVLSARDGALWVNWDEPANPGTGVTGYAITVSNGSATSFIVESPDTSEPYGIRTSARVDGLINGQDYDVTVSAISGIRATCESGNLGPSTSTPFSTTGPTWTTATPLSATSYGNVVALEWDEPAPEGVSYTIDRGTGPDGPWFEVEGNVTVRDLIDDNDGAGWTTGAVFYYRVTALDASNNTSDLSNIAQVTIVDDAAPTDLSASQVADDGTTGEVDLTWTLPSTAPSDELRIYRCSGSGCTPTSQVATIPGGATSFTDTSVAPGTYRYAVTNVAGGQESDQALTGNVAVEVPPVAPTNPATSVAGDTVTVSWLQPAGSAATSYTVLRCGGAGCTPTSSIGTTASTGDGGHSYVDAGRPDGLWRYRIVATNAQGTTSTPAGPVGATVDVAPPAVPTGLALRAVDDTGDGEINDVDATWDDNSEADLASYEIQRCLGAGCVPNTTVGTPVASRHIDTGRPDGLWRYHVIAYDTSGNPSAPSPVVEIDIDTGA